MLSRDIKFINYNLTIKPNLQNYTYIGSEIIKYKVVNKTNTIELNAKQVTITRTSINNIIEPVTTLYDKKNEKYVIVFDREIENGHLYVEFNGILNDQMAGFYRTIHNDQIACVTQFEATDARRCFPCADIPSMKATFDVTLIIPNNLMCVSNMPVKYIVNGEYGLKRVVFEKTPIMSTYLLAFYVGQSDYIENKVIIGGDREVYVRVYTRVGESKRGEFALELACKTLAFFSKYFEIDYPLPKLDMIGIPDFAAGAMENWGFVTYRESALLCDENTSTYNKIQIAYTICHELAHQWFGNLVTMEWWDDLWLNEGFATWVGWFAVDNFFPEWKVWELFIDEEFNDALELDKLASSHPIHVEIYDEKKVDEIFDAISYSKGACIIRMLADYLGNNVFRKGVNAYLQKYKYSNAKTNDLWDVLTETTGQDIGGLMDTWVNKTGYPIIDVMYANGKLHLEQKRYNCNENDDVLWICPLFSNVVMDERYMVVDASCFKLNVGQTGFYRTRYSDDLLMSMGENINIFETIDRAEIINNLASYVECGIDSIVKTLDYLKYYVNETEYLVWNIIITFMNKVYKIFKTDFDLNNKLKQFYISLLEPIYYKTDNKLLKSMVTSTMMYLGYPETVQKCRDQFENILNVDPDFQKTVIISQILNDNGFDKVMALYNNENATDTIKKYCLYAIGYVKDVNQLFAAFDFAFKSGKVRKQDAYAIFYSSVYNNVSPTWQYLKNNWEMLCDLYKDGSFLFGRLLSIVIANMGEELIDDASAFFKEHHKVVEPLKMTLEQAFEEAHNGNKWRERDVASVYNYFN